MGNPLVPRDTISGCKQTVETEILKVKADRKHECQNAMVEGAVYVLARDQRPVASHKNIRRIKVEHAPTVHELLNREEVNELRTFDMMDGEDTECVKTATRLLELVLNAYETDKNAYDKKKESEKGKGTDGQFQPNKLELQWRIARVLKLLFDQLIEEKAPNLASRAMNLLAELDSLMNIFWVEETGSE